MNGANRGMHIEAKIKQTVSEGRGKLDKVERFQFRNGSAADGERGRLDRYRRRPADGSNRFSASIGEWNLQLYLFGETPNRATGTVALPPLRLHCYGLSLGALARASASLIWSGVKR